MSKKYYDPKFKLKVILETLNTSTTLESVRKKYNLSHNALNHWRKQFYTHGHTVFESNDKGTNSNNESFDDLKRIIADLTIENSILKKVSSLRN